MMVNNEFNAENAPDQVGNSKIKMVLDGVKKFLVKTKTLDLNPHEGRLRGSVMPEQYMQIPDDLSDITDKDDKK